MVSQRIKTTAIENIKEGAQVEKVRGWIKAECVRVKAKTGVAAVK